MAAIAFSLVIAFSQQSTTQAGPEVSRPVPQSLLPQSVGVGIASNEAVLVAFDEPMDPSSVEGAVHVSPATDVELSWNDDRNLLSVRPAERWQTDETYLLVVDQSATTDSGSTVPAERFAFSTQTAPTVSEFHVTLASADLPSVDGPQLKMRALSVEQEPAPDGALSPEETAHEVSTSSSVRIGFSAPMNRADTEANFSIAPEADGELTWEGNDLVFTPSERLAVGGRYTISLVGAHDRLGNALGGKSNFSFLVRGGPQMVKASPGPSAKDAEPQTVEMWFNQPMDVDATNAAFGITDTSTGALVAGRLNWNEDATQIVYSPDRPLAGGRTYTVALGEGAVDADGNSLSVEWSFTTKAAPPAAVARSQQQADANARAGAAARPPAPPPITVGASGLEGYGLAQINNARAAYGFGPLFLDAGLSAAASAHAWDQVNRGYYAHSGRPGGYAAWGQNQCHHYGLGAQRTIDWCHGVFMSEPWPGHPNHIGNILSTRYSRVGIGVADNGSRVVITWNFGS